MRKHQLLSVNSVRLHAVEEGEGPLVLLLHGFPELWYSWRRQMEALAQAGYRAVAIDQRGYGRSSKLWDPRAYHIQRLVEDAVGIVHALGERRAVVVGHDWGAPVAWTAAWLHPEVFRGVLGMSVPFSGRGLIALPGNPFGERSPHEVHLAMSGPDADFYQVYFSTLGPILDEIESDLRGWVRDIVWSVSGDALRSAGVDFSVGDPVAHIRQGAVCIPHGQRMRDRFLTPPVMPEWFTPEDLDVFVDSLERGGFAGPLSYYRNLEDDWTWLEAQAERPVEVPAMFLGGTLDVATAWGKEAIERAREKIPNWMGSRILDGCGHWMAWERTEATNAVLLEFLRAL